MSLDLEQLHNIRQSLPAHIAIIMDGNGRWAQQRGKLRAQGHQAGVKSVRRAVSLASQLGIKSLTLFAFSSENWRRPADEVSSLMNLFLTVLQRELKKLDESGVQLRVIGDLSRFSEKLQRRIREAEEKTASNTGLQLNIAANYGGRWDITHAVQTLTKQVSEGQLQLSELTEARISEEIAKQSLGDIDLLIRTGGEKRISNFLLWQMAYAELYFSDDLWPDFDEQAFSAALASFVGRERRFGCTGEQIRELLGNQSTNEANFA